MPKLKTKSGAKKRFSLTASGKVRSNQANKRHGMIKRTNKQIRNQRGTTILSPQDAGIVKGFMPHMSDHRFLQVMRITIVGFTLLVLAFALNTNASIFKMVENAYKVTLAGAFVPLVVGAFWKRATTQGALFATFGGLGSWLAIEVYLANTGTESSVPPQLIGLAISLLGMAAGSLLPQWLRAKPTFIDDAKHLHPHAAAQTHHATPTHHTHHPGA